MHSRWKTGQKFGKWEIITEPTEEEEGLEKRECSICKQEETQKIEKLSHTHKWEEDNDVPKKAATCTENGSITYKCSKCGETKEDIIPMTGHNFVKDPNGSIEAGCETDGKDHYKCSKCGETKDETRDALGHQFDEQTGICSRCHKQNPAKKPEENTNPETNQSVEN